LPARASGPEGFSAVVIDGYNLINRVPELSARLAGAGLEQARSYLLGWLRRYQEVRHRRVMLVLDGPKPGRSDFGPVEVYYSPAADEAVVKMAGAGILVVSSDNAVASGARLTGATVLGSDDFWRAMTANASPRPRRRPADEARTRTGVGGGGADVDADPARWPDGSGQRPSHGRRGHPKKLTKREKRRRREHDELMRRV